MAVKTYVGAVALAAALVGFLAAQLVPATDGPAPATLVVFVIAVALAELMQVRYYTARGVDALNLLEGVMAPLLFVGSGTQVVVVTAIGVALASAIGRNDRVKALFNVAQWSLAAATASLALHLLRAHTSYSGQSVVALAVAVGVLAICNNLLFAGVLLTLNGRRWRTLYGKDIRGALVGHASSLVANVTVGVCLTAAYIWSYWTLLLSFALIAGMHATGRANAAVHADRKRLEGLQRATHALATSLEIRQAIPVFLAEAQAGFEVKAIELALFSPRGTVVHSCTGPTADDYAVRTGSHELAETLAEYVTTTVRLVGSADQPDLTDALERAGHQRGLAVPLRSGRETTGMLFLFDRVGIEGFEAGEQTIATALGRELVSFLERVDLVSAIEEERRKLADILESTSDGILTMDSDGVVTSWNSGLADMTGYGGKEMVGTRHFGLLRARDANGRDVLIERWLDILTEGGSLPPDLQIVTAEGEALWLSCSYSRIPAADDRRDVLVIVARNITKARELERLKDDFVAVVSHELRTPLVPIKGWAQTLINRGDRLTDDQRRTAVQSILAQAQKLESLVLNILEASRIESGRGDSEGVTDVGTIVVRIVEDTVAARPDRVVRVRPPSVPCQVRGSAVWVERAVSNLVANAVKYSPDDEPVDVTITVQGDEVLVAVTDRGPGIATDSQDRIFERFERLEETSKQTGTGLGLYITRRLARAMGGDVNVSSVPGAGSTFLLRLPLAQVNRMPHQRTEGNPARDDDPQEPANVVRLH